MKDPAAISPFAAKNSQEQKEQWIWWQCQSDALLPVEEKAEEKIIPELKMPEPAKKEAPVSIQQRMPTHHSQYDAVLRRIKNASKQTGNYTSVPE